MNKHADRAQMESDDVAALKVFSTGDNAMRARNTKIDDLSALVPVPQERLVGCRGNLEKPMDDLCFAALCQNENNQVVPTPYILL